MKKVISILICIVLGMSCMSMMACGNEDTLRVYNCYDYIDEDLLDEFEKYYEEKTGKSIKVEYSCYDTPEDAYNNLKIDPTAYDLLCPSDYMIEKMAQENMLQKIDMDADGEYAKNLSPYIKDVFKGIKWKEGDNDVSLYDYAVGYMWGTLGLVYNPDKVDRDDMKAWNSLLDHEYKNSFSIKDSVRDTYFMALAINYNTELNNAKNTYEQGGTLSAYQTTLKEYFNDTKSETVKKVKSILINLGNNCKSLEVDEGKLDVAEGKIDINIAWSGDAVYALDLGEENNLSLEYSVPEEGSNIWFDGWVIPKESKKSEEAKAFLDFISTPPNVIKNMDYIGYTSVIAGETVFDYVKENYDEGKGESTDLNYFFGDGNHTIKTEETRRQFYAQYPTQEVIERCAVMNYFPAEANKSINEMWIEFRGSIN